MVEAVCICWMDVEWPVGTVLSDYTSNDVTYEICGNMSSQLGYILVLFWSTFSYEASPCWSLSPETEIAADIDVIFSTELWLCICDQTCRATKKELSIILPIIPKMIANNLYMITRAYNVLLNYLALVREYVQASCVLL